jgi:hypothetical protein
MPTVLLITYTGNEFLVQLSSSTTENTTYSFTCSDQTHLYPVLSNGVEYNKPNKTILVPPGINVFTFSLVGSSGPNVTINIGGVAYSAPIDLPLSVLSVTWTGYNFLVQLSEPTTQAYDLHFYTSRSTPEQLSNDITYTPLVPPAAPPLPASEGILTLPAGINVFTFKLTDVNIFAGETVTITIEDASFVYDAATLLGVQSIVYNADGFLVQLTNPTVETTTIPCTTSVSYPIPDNNVTFDSRTNSVTIPPGLSSFGFNLDGAVNLVGTSVIITIGGITLTQVLTNTVIGPVLPSPGTTTDYSVYLSSMANSLANIASKITAIESHQQTLTNLASTVGIRTQGQYDDANQIAIYKLLVEQNGANLMPTVEVTSILANVCYTATNHSLAVNDEFIPKSTQNGLIEGVTYYIKDVPSANQFSLKTTNDATAVDVILIDKVKITSILNNVCTSIKAHSMNINDSFIAKTSLNGFIAGTTYYVNSIPAEDKFTVTVSTDPGDRANVDLISGTTPNLIVNLSITAEVLRNDVSAAIAYSSKVKRLSGY